MECLLGMGEGLALTLEATKEKNMVKRLPDQKPQGSCFLQVVCNLFQKSNHSTCSTKSPPKGKKKFRKLSFSWTALTVAQVTKFFIEIFTILGRSTRKMQLLGPEHLSRTKRELRSRGRRV